MTKVRLLVPIEGQGATNDVINVSAEQATEWRAAGKCTLLSTEEALAAQPGHYSDVVGREEVGQVRPQEPAPGPQEDDEPPARKGGKK